MFDNQLKLNTKKLFSIYVNNGDVNEWAEEASIAYYKTEAEALADLRAENGKKEKINFSEEEMLYLFDENTKQLKEFVLYTEQDKNDPWCRVAKEEVILFEGKEWRPVSEYYYVAPATLDVWDESDDSFLI